MKSKHSIYDLINNSYLTLFGFTSSDEDIVGKFFDTICYRNLDKVVRLYTDVYHSEHSLFENYQLNTIDEIYTIIPKFQNKIIIIDNIGMLQSAKVDSHNPAIRTKMFRKVMRDLREYSNSHDCFFVMGNLTYESPSTTFTTQKFVGGDTMTYGADNVFMVKKGELSCQKSRYTDPKEFNGLNIKSVYFKRRKS